MRRITGWVVVASLAACAAGPDAERTGASRLASPLRPAPPAAGAVRPCAPVAPPVRDVQGVIFYADAAGSRPDPERVAADRAAQGPLDDWLRGIGRDLSRHRRGEAGAAGCVVAAVKAWARDGALLGTFNRQGENHRSWALSGAALAFLAARDGAARDGAARDGAARDGAARDGAARDGAVRDGAARDGAARDGTDVDPAASARAAAWLGAVAGRVRATYDRPSGAAISHTRNNLAAWAGLAVAASGVAAGDRGALDWGVARLRDQLSAVDARGALPQEVARGRLALHYHLFALQPVAALSRIAAANGVALTPAEADALRRLRRLTFEAARDPAVMERIAGVPQEQPWEAGRPFLGGAAGLEILGAGEADAAEDAALAPFRPYGASWLGGEVTGRWR